MTVTLPYVDPLRQRGVAYRSYAAFLGTRVGVWTAINVAARVDPTLLRLSRGRLAMGLMLPSALLETRGARSGQARANAVLYFHDGPDVIIVASSMGRARHPAWYHNVVAHPDVRLGGRSWHAEEVDDEYERNRLWRLGDRVYPPYATYRRQTAAVGRRIPILRLRPADADPTGG